MAFKELLATLRGEGDYAGFARRHHFDVISFPWETLEQVENGTMVPSPAFAELLRDEIAYKSSGTGERVFRSAMASYEARNDSPVLHFGDEDLAQFRVANFIRMMRELLNGDHLEFARSHHLRELEKFKRTELWMIEKGKMVPSPAFAEFLRDEIAYANSGMGQRLYNAAMAAYERRGDLPVMVFTEDMLAEYRRNFSQTELSAEQEVPAGRDTRADGALQREQRRLERLRQQEERRVAARIGREAESTWRKHEAESRKTKPKNIWREVEALEKADQKQLDRQTDLEIRAYNAVLDAEEAGLQDWIRRDNALTGMSRSVTLGEFYEHFDAFSDRPIISFAREATDKSALRHGDLPSMDALDAIGQYLRGHQHRESVLTNFHVLCSAVVAEQQHQRRIAERQAVDRVRRNQEKASWKRYDEARNRGVIPEDEAQSEADHSVYEDNARLDNQEAALREWLRRDTAFTVMMESETLPEFYAGLSRLSGTPVAAFGQSAAERVAIAQGQPVSRTTMRGINDYLEKVGAHFFVTRNFERLCAAARKEEVEREREVARAARVAAQPPSGGRSHPVPGGGRGRPASSGRTGAVTVTREDLVQATKARMLETDTLESFLGLLPALTGLPAKTLGKVLKVGGGFKGHTEKATFQFDTQKHILGYLRTNYGEDIAAHFDHLYKYPKMPDGFIDDVTATTSVATFLTTLGDSYPRSLAVLYEISGISKSSFYHWSRGLEFPPRDRIESLSTCLRELTGSDVVYEHLERVWDTERAAHVTQADVQKTAEMAAATVMLDTGVFSSFGDFLRLLREERGLSQTEAGTVLGISNSIVSNREKNSSPPVNPKAEDEYVRLSPARGALIRAQFAAERQRRDKAHEEAAGEDTVAKRPAASAVSVRTLTAAQAKTRIEKGKGAEGGYNTVGELLGLARLEAGITQRELGEKVKSHIQASGGDPGITTQARLSDIERGKGRALPSEQEGICAALPERAVALREAFEAVEAGTAHAPRVIARRMPPGQATAEIEGMIERGEVPDVHRLLHLLRMEKGVGIRALRRELGGETGEESLTANERTRMPTASEIGEWRSVLPEDRYALLEASHAAATGKADAGWVGRSVRAPGNSGLESRDR
ncbi:MAG TPA: helix-turn-helix transcriptional regulator [Rickettsiales bacterium]|nr:helix-turn-helix transcriptional regulator [Rickettsiales bacterium]